FCLLRRRLVPSTVTHTNHLYTLSLHDALPILNGPPAGTSVVPHADGAIVLAYKHMVGKEFRSGPVVQRRIVNIDPICAQPVSSGDRKSTRLNSSHVKISYAVFCLKKKNTISP